jgi:hypothetical protein
VGAAYFRFYNEDRFHETRGYRTPQEAYFGTPARRPWFFMVWTDISAPEVSGRAGFRNFKKVIAFGQRLD